MGDGGFIAVDALVALALTVLALVSVLHAYAATLTMARRASAERQASALALWVLETQWPRLERPGMRQGAVARGWSWRLDAVASRDRPDWTLCHVRVVVRKARDIALRFDTDKICSAPP